METAASILNQIKHFLSRYQDESPYLENPCPVSETSTNQEPSPEVSISSVRSAFLSKYGDKLHNFHTKDIERLKNDDFFVRRLINGAKFNHGDVGTDRVVDLTFEILTWRQEYGINNFEAKDFAAEVMKCGMMRQSFLHNGDVLICVIGRRYKIVPGVMENAIIPGILWYYEVCVVPYLRKKPDAKLHVIFDATKCGMSQADMAMVYVGVPILSQYYPGVVHRCYIHNLSPVLIPFCNLFKKFIPEKFRNIGYLTTDSNISSFIGAQNVPDVMGGPLKTFELETIEGMVDIEHCGVAKKFSKSDIEKFKKVVEDAFLIK